jgi:hypothetical protein
MDAIDSIGLDASRNTMPKKQSKPKRKNYALWIHNIEKGMK